MAVSRNRARGMASLQSPTPYSTLYTASASGEKSGIKTRICEQSYKSHREIVELELFTPFTCTMTTSSTDFPPLKNDLLLRAARGQQAQRRMGVVIVLAEI